MARRQRALWARSGNEKLANVQEIGKNPRHTEKIVRRETKERDTFATPQEKER